ncbi:MAG: hypothetical protein WCT37_01785 [Patescibacteria group bacterium]|jgi:hypothetical protein
MSKDLKAGAIAELRTWAQEQKAEIARREKSLTALLIAVVPKNLDLWLEEGGETVIKNLLEYGTASRKYRDDDDDKRSYSYTNLKDFEKRFQRLQVAWAGIVNIKIDWDGTYRFEVSFAVVQKPGRRPSQKSNNQ